MNYTFVTKEVIIRGRRLKEEEQEEYHHNQQEQHFIVRVDLSVSIKCLCVLAMKEFSQKYL